VLYEVYIIQLLKLLSNFSMPKQCATSKNVSHSTKSFIFHFAFGWDTNKHAPFGNSLAIKVTSKRRNIAKDMIHSCAYKDFNYTNIFHYQHNRSNFVNYARIDQRAWCTYMSTIECIRGCYNVAIIRQWIPDTSEPRLVGTEFTKACQYKILFYKCFV